MGSVYKEYECSALTLPCFPPSLSTPNIKIEEEYLRGWFLNTRGGSSARLGGKVIPGMIDD